MQITLYKISHLQSQYVQYIMQSHYSHTLQYNNT